VKVCLDAGHGKETAGKQSPDGSLLEYEFNRDVATRIKNILERHNIEVFLTCDDDHDIDLKTRCMYANANECDYFVSIHANAHKEYWTDANGWEIHIIGKGGNAEKLAKCIQKHSIADLGLKDRGIKISNFQVLKDTDMPAVLIEHGFYTNKEEVEKLKDSTFRQKCAMADAKGILEHLGIEYIIDVPAEHRPSECFLEAWNWCKEKGYLDGTNPKGTVTREMLAQVLFNLFGKEK
jgi:N-acetylmuramoyl-L-alanine amidase